jgi:hypothetical protein
MERVSMVVVDEGSSHADADNARLVQFTPCLRAAIEAAEARLADLDANPNHGAKLRNAIRRQAPAVCQDRLLWV